MRKSFFVGMALLSFFILTNSAYCAKPAKVAEKARKAKGSLIACSPKGDVPDTVPLAEGIKKLSKNSELRLSPGDYGKAMINIKTNDIIITGSDPNELCKIDLMITGKCVIRNVHLRAVYIDCDVTIVDSIIDKCYLKYTGKKKTMQVVDNSCFNFMYIEPANKIVALLNSTIANSKYGIEFGTMTIPNTKKRVKGEMIMHNCVICGDGVPYFADRGTSLATCAFTMGKTILFGEWGVYTTREGKDAATKTLKKGHKILKYKLKDKKKNFFIKPEFKEKGSFILSEDFAKKYKYPGANFNKDGVLTPAKKR